MTGADLTSLRAMVVRASPGWCSLGAEAGDAEGSDLLTGAGRTLLLLFLPAALTDRRPYIPQPPLPPYSHPLVPCHLQKSYSWGVIPALWICVASLEFLVPGNPIPQGSAFPSVLSELGTPGDSPPRKGVFVFASVGTLKLCLRSVTVTFNS